MKKTKKDADDRMMMFITAKWISGPLYTAAKLNIAGILSEGPKSINEISDICKAYAPYLYRVMRALSSVGIFVEKEPEVFDLTPMAESLKQGRLRSIALMFLSEWHNRAWEYLYHSVLTGDSAFDTAFGMPAFEWLKKNEEAAEIFNKANSINAGKGYASVIDHYDFSKFRIITDIGGGFGGLLLRILKGDKDLNGVIADLPYMFEDIKHKIKDEGLETRCRAVECDFFNKVPDGSDAYILSHILHDWDDQKCKTILRNCYDAMSSKARLLIFESIIPEGNGFSITKLLDIEVMVMGGGKERTEAEYRELLSGSGFTIKNISGIGSDISLLECSK